MTDVAVGAPAADVEPRGSATRRRWWRVALDATAPALVYLGVRQAGALILAVMAARGPVSVGEHLTSWDGRWFLGIAAHGYTNAPSDLTDANHDRTADTALAFFPGYPTAVRWVDALPFFSLQAAAFTVTLVFGVAAAFAVARIGELIRGGSRRTGLLLVALFAASPMGIVLSMTYSEAMFCAFAAWALVFVLRGQWPAAGVCCALAGLVRPTALALAVAVVAAAVVFAVRHNDARPRVGALVGGLLAPAGLVGYLWWAGARIEPGAGFLEQLGSWSEVQRTGWGTGFDGGGATLDYVGYVLTSSDSVHDVGTVAVLVGAVALTVLALRDRLDWPLLVYGAGVLAMVVTSSGLMNAKARLLLPAFVLLVPIAVRLAKRHPAGAWLTVAAVAAVSGWFGGEALVVYEYAI